MLCDYIISIFKMDYNYNQIPTTNFQNYDRFIVPQIVCDKHTYKHKDCNC